MLQRLARPIARHPLVVLLVALVVVAGTAAGLVRFNVDAGTGLLVGSQSDAGKANAQFTAAFGTDPIVVVLSTPVAAAPYIEKNLQRLVALEDDLNHDPNVQTVLGPGTVALSALSATTSEVNTTLTEYPYFVAETDLLVSGQGQSNDQAVQKLQQDFSAASTILQLYVKNAAADANNGRVAAEQATPKPSDRIIDTAERAADAAANKDPLPPLFVNYLGAPNTAVPESAAHQIFDRLTAAYGTCSQAVAALIGASPSCQVYLDRFLLDLPNCPTFSAVSDAAKKGTALFCPPKLQWRSVLPQPAVNANGSSTSNEIITVRLTPQAAANRAAVLEVQQKINAGLQYGIGTPHGISDAYTNTATYQQNRIKTISALGPLAPTDCGDVGETTGSSCYQAYGNKPFTWTIAGAPLLTYGVVDAMTQNLLELFPIVLVLMAVLLVATFRLRGRLWPLLAAAVGSASTIGIALWIGLSITPAVLAGVPVLVGLGVDYAVQLVARYDEARAGGADPEAAAAAALERAGPATLTAALATLAGLVALMVVSGVDLGPLVAVPLVAEFALVLCAGVALAWLSAVFVALPAAVRFDNRAAAAPVQTAAPRRPERTLGIASAWRGAVVPAAIASLVGWVLLPGVPVQTGIEQLLAPSIPQVQAIQQVRNETGYGNELDVFIHGQVAGPYTQSGPFPDNVRWQCSLAEQIQVDNPEQVAQTTAISDFFLASSASATKSAGGSCEAPSSSSTGGGGATPSPGASASPSAAATPSAATTPSSSPSAARASGAVLMASGPASPSASAAATPSPSGSAAASPGATTTPSTQAAITQSQFLCNLRLLPGLARNLVAPLPYDSQPCPGRDFYFNRWLGKDADPIDPSAGRIAIGVQGTSVAEQAKLVDNILHDIRTAAPPNGMTAAPAGIAAVAAQAYDNIVSRGLLLNLVPLVIVFLALLLIERDLRRALLPLLPTALAAGWAPLLLRLLGLLPGSLGQTLGSFNPLTVVMGALVIALATEFGVVLLRRFDEEMARGLSPDDAAAAALAGTGRAIRVSALTLGAGFAVLAVSALLPGGLPLLGSFGLTVLIDLALAVAAVFGIMLPVAVAFERSRWVPGAVPAASSRAPVVATAAAADLTAPETASPPVTPRRPSRPRLVDEPVTPTTTPSSAEEPTSGRRRPSVSGRRRGGGGAEPAAPADTPAEPQAPRRPGVSGRRRQRPVVPGEDEPPSRDQG